MTIFEKANKENRPVNIRFACLDCPFAKWQLGINPNTLKMRVKARLEEENYTRTNIGKKDLTSDEEKTFKDATEKEMLELEEIKKDIVFCYCTKTHNYTFKNSPTEYLHFEECDFKNESMDEVANKI